MQGKSKANRIITLVIIIILALLFTFPLYWIITGSFKTAKEVNSVTPVWWPSEWTLKNYQTLMSKLKAPLWEFYVPFSQYFSADGNPVAFSVGPTVPGAIRWMLNTVWMAVAAMLLTCVTSALAGYALAKKRFVGRTLIFTLIVCAMALPKQVILIPLIREMSSLKLYNTLSAVIYPIVGWPFGVFLIKQFAESIPGEILEAARIDGAGELKTFNQIVFPMIKPGVGALAKRLDEMSLTNVRIVRHDAVEIVRDMIAENSLDGVHIYFPDPWRKARHHKRRLVAQPFIGLLASRIRPGGYIHCATDWENYSEQMLEVLEGEPLLENLHGAGNFSPVMGNPLCERPRTKFQARGERLGYGIWDLVYIRKQPAPSAS